MIIELLILINLARVIPLKVDTNLNDLANKRAEIVYSDFSHSNWMNSFKDTKCSYIGENLAKGFDNNPYSIHSVFMDSFTHRKNILNTNYNKIGIGHYEDITVELFCREI